MPNDREAAKVSQPKFIPGLELNRRFYSEAVRPILNTHFPKLPHDLWLYLLAALWWRIENEEHLMGFISSTKSTFSQKSNHAEALGSCGVSVCAPQLIQNLLPSGLKGFKQPGLEH